MCDCKHTASSSVERKLVIMCSVKTVVREIWMESRVVAALKNSLLFIYFFKVTPCKLNIVNQDTAVRSEQGFAPVISSSPICNS